MTRVPTKGQVIIPENIRNALGIESGDEIVFAETESGYKIQKTKPTMANRKGPFEKYRDTAESDETMLDRMRRLRGEFPRDVGREDSAEPEA